MESRRRQTREKVSWTEAMTADLLQCKNDARESVNGSNPPLKPNGKKVGYMQCMHKFWLAKGYGHFGFTAQNISDKANQVERKHKQFQDTISHTVSQDISNVNVANDYETTSRLRNYGNLLNTTDIDEIKLNELIMESERVYKDIVCIHGDMSKREYRTKFKSTPLKEDIKYIDNACKLLIDKYEITLIADKLVALWYVNCIAYSVIASWIKVTSIKGMSNISTNNRKEFRVSKCVADIEMQIKYTRAYLSQSDAELRRLKTRGRLTRKTLRNRAIIEKDCDGIISIYSLTCLVMKLKKRLKYLAKKRLRTVKAENARKINNDFKNDQSSVFTKFKNTIDDQPDNLFPVYKETTKDRKYFDDPVPVEGFWRGLWEANDSGNPEVSWLNEIEKVFCDLVPDINEGNLNLTEEICWNGIKKKKNWSAAGPDGICNFWWKKLTSVLHVTSSIFIGLINEEKGIEAWYCRGRTVLIEKLGEWSKENQRPITCLNTHYKWLTSILLIFQNSHLSKYNLMQIDQRGSKEGTSGTVNNLLIDDMVSRDVALRRRNIFYYWIDVKKAFDSVSHSWVSKMYKIHRVPTKLSKMVENIIKKWNLVLVIPVKDGYVQTESIKLTNGILQGDSLCPSLYTLSKNVISWLIRSFEGYMLSKPICKKVTHLLFIDDLKGYVKSREALIFCLRVIWHAMQCAGLLWNMKKCKYLEMKRGSFVEGDPIPIVEGVHVPSLKADETYKFMGVPQFSENDMKSLEADLLMKIKKRTHIVWSSGLSDLHKVTASNLFINSGIEYYFWTLRFNIQTLKEFDSTIRGIMNKLGAKHTNIMNSILYMPRGRGGRGLRSLEVAYKEIKIKAAVKLLNDDEDRMKVVRKFHYDRMLTSSYSLFKNSKLYAQELDLKLDITADDFVVHYEEADGETKDTNDVKVISKEIIRRRNNRYHMDICKSTWQGVNFVSRLEDELVVKDYFSWLRMWKTCPTSIVTEFFLMFYQVLSTKCYLQTRSSQDIPDKKCRICNVGDEHVKHILSNCPVLVKKSYKTRHDNALKCFIFPMLHHFKLIDEIPPWYSNKKVTPYLEKDDVKFWWDVPEYSGKEDTDEQESNPLRPDGKIMFKNGEETIILLIEMTVPWMGNRFEKYLFKKDKYKDIIQNLKLENPGSKVDQITLVVDGFGGYGADLRANIKKVMTDRKKQDSVIMNMQKTVLSSLSNISRRFKVNAM